MNAHLVVYSAHAPLACALCPPSGHGSITQRPQRPPQGKEASTQSAPRRPRIKEGRKKWHRDCAPPASKTRGGASYSAQNLSCVTDHNVSCMLDTKAQNPPCLLHVLSGQCSCGRAGREHCTRRAWKGRKDLERLVAVLLSMRRKAANHSEGGLGSGEGRHTLFALQVLASPRNSTPR